MKQETSYLSTCAERLCASMAPKNKRQKTQSSFSVEESDREKFANALLGSKYGHIYCEQLGISLTPGNSDSLYQWLCCSILMSSGLSEKLTTRVRTPETSSNLCSGRSRPDATLTGMSCPVGCHNPAVRSCLVRAS